MQIDHRAQRFGALPERIERRVIEILAIGVAVDHGAAEFEVVHAALQLVRGGERILHREVREAGILIGPLLNLARQEIIALARLADGGRGIALDLHAGAGQ